MTDRRVAWLGISLVAAGIILIAVAAALGPGPRSPSSQAAAWGFGSRGMMGFGPSAISALGPGSPDFVAGTSSEPRVVRIIASDALRFYPDAVAVKQGETITFEVATLGMTSHEFMVGPAADVATHTETTSEIADIGMMATKSLTYTFSGPGPFGFACHAPGHYEAGMSGAIVIVP